MKTPTQLDYGGLKIDFDIFVDSYIARSTTPRDIEMGKKKADKLAVNPDWPRTQHTPVPHDVNLMDILTIQCRVVMVTHNDEQDKAAIVAFMRRAADLLAIMRMLGDRRCSMKVEWRKGIDAWTSNELSTEDIEGLQGHVSDVGDSDRAPRKEDPNAYPG